MFDERFPRSSKYDPEWVLSNQMGPNALWLTESLCERMTLKPGMRVLDMGCGTAISSIFLAKEFGVRVWANDLWVSAEENQERIAAAGVDDLVTPVRAEAHSLPYDRDFFDAVISIDSFHYYGTSDTYFRLLQHVPEVWRSDWHGRSRAGQRHRGRPARVPD